MKRIFIKALASGQTIPLPPLSSAEWDLTLLSYLRLQQIPIASSCNGEGVCKKCTVNEVEGNSLLSCQVTLRELFSHTSTDSLIISIDYL